MSSAHPALLPAMYWLFEESEQNDEELGDLL